MDYEVKLQYFYERLLRKGDVAIDVGAHSGRHSVPIGQSIGRAGHLYCFEPLPHVRHWLAAAIGKAAAAGNDIAEPTIFDCALGAENAVAEFVHAIDAPEYSGLQERIYDNPTRLERIPVVVRKLDDVLSALAACHYIKIDAEGGEFDIVQGGSTLIARTQPVVTFEFGANSLRNYATTPAAMFDYWHDRHYVVLDILGRRLDRDAFVDSATRQQVWDYIAIPAGRNDAMALARQATPG